MRTKLYSQIAKNTFTQFLTYRIDLFGSSIRISLSAIASLIFWYAIYQTNSDVSIYNTKTILGYFILMPIIGAFTMIVSNIGRDIKDGKFSNHLTKPYGITKFFFVKQIAKKSVFLLHSLPVYFLITTIVIIRFNLNFNIGNLLIGLSFAIGALILHFFMDTTISWLAFWIDEVWAFGHFKRILFVVLGGLSIPLDFYPRHLYDLVSLLPFKYIFYIPISYSLGMKTDTNTFIIDILLLLFWILFFIITSHLLLKRGLKKYGAFGN